ncbi:MAG: radical SAM protein [Bacilli bacterium]|nr:radical SAM protein [Bacilli bacterium]
MKKRFKKIYVEITNSCNLNCDFCIKNKRNKKFISISEFQVVLDKIKDYTDYLYFHILGEPLLHPKINELIDIASKNFKINITTNGYLIDKIKNNKNIRQLNISLHSFDDRYQIDLNNYLDNIFNTIDILIKNNTFISLRLWVKNKYHKNIIDYVNNKYDTNIDYNIDNYTINNRLFINNFHEFIWPDLNNNTYEEIGTCYGLIDHIGILVDGTIIPCCLDSMGEINLGNIYINNLDEILESNRAKNMINNFKNNKKCEELCKHCKFIEK